MTVYVDNARILATVGRHISRWSHLTADTKDELHDFAARLGLRRSYFQTCKATRWCPPETCPHWHYDLTASKREQALRIGAQPMDTRRWAEIIRTRRAGGQA
jgi:uncharacterized protein DUF4031